jgi:hypothetical protein
VAGQGNAGGTNGGFTTSPYPSGGGGGAGTVGLNAATVSRSGNGGAGIASAISGTVTVYAGGGGGGAYGGAAVQGSGGVGGGGAGGPPSAGTGLSGTVNTGGGGGGSSDVAGSGAGGSGIVVVRYPGNVQFYTGGTVTYSNGYIVHTFKATGTLSPTTPTVVSDYQISRSLRFNLADSAYLNRTPATTTTRTTWTWSGWVKRASFGSSQVLFGAGPDGSNYTILYFSGTVSENLEIYNYTAGVTTGYVYTTSVFRDPSAWYHVVLAVDTNQDISANRIKIYVNGVVQPVTINTTFASSVNTWVNTNNPHQLGSTPTTSALYGGYMTEVNFIDGQALTPTSFGYVNPTTGVWSPAKFVGGYGTNGFYLNFSDNSNTTAATLGADSSGNGNNWTPNNFSVTAGAGNDSMVDSPISYGTDTGLGGEVRGNYATMNPIGNPSVPTYSITNGNLDYAATGGSGNATKQAAIATIGVTTGKWYYEGTVTSNNPGLGFSSGLFYNSQRGTIRITYFSGSLANSAGITATGSPATFTNGDVIAVAYDADAGTATVYKNNVSQGTFSGIATGTALFPYVEPNTADAGSGVSFNFGQRPFAYTAPSGYKALCTQNLPTPTVGGSAASLATKYFNILTYTGNGLAGNARSGLGFQPDFLWFKSRSGARSHGLFNSVATRAYGLASEVANEQYTSAAGRDLASFDSDGFTVGVPENFNSTNASGDSIVTWAWKGGGTAVNNTAGSITSQVSASPISGFSTLTYTGNGTAGATVGHGLGAVPQMMIVKNRITATSWRVYMSVLGNVYSILLNSTAGVRSDLNSWNTTTPTSTVFTLGSDAGVNEDGRTFIAYCFTPIAGYSAFGSYTGNGSTNGPFVHTGFRPAYIMVRRSNSSDGGEWKIHDATRTPFNWTCNVLFANGADVENTTENEATYGVDMLSNGFKIRASHSSHNTSDAPYIYMAFASHPFKYSLAR